MSRRKFKIIPDKSTPKDNEVSAWTVAIGNVMPMNYKSFMEFNTQAQGIKEAMEYINKLDGILGIHPMPPKGTLVLFKNVDYAIKGKAAMDKKGIQTGFNICECYVNKMFIKEENNDTQTDS